MSSARVSLAVTTWLFSFHSCDSFGQMKVPRHVEYHLEEQTRATIFKLRQAPPRYRGGQPLRFGNWFEQLWVNPTPEVAKLKEPEVLKRQLLDVVQPTQRGVATTRGQRTEINRLIAALEPFNPNPGRPSGDVLSALWVLQWTTEKEVLFLMERGLFGLPAGPVHQNVDVDSGMFSNTMLFGPDSFLSVSSSYIPKDDGRANFRFNTCSLKYRDMMMPLPPVGKGWFQHIYLDNDLRVTKDIRGDVAVLIKGH